MHCPQIDLFQALHLRAQIEILSNDLSAIARDPRKELGIFRCIKQCSRKFLMIKLGHKDA
jgi:hypothetical protein